MNADLAPSHAAAFQLFCDMNHCETSTIRDLTQLINGEVLFSGVRRNGSFWQFTDIPYILLSNLVLILFDSVHIAVQLF
jgi:hypothetical protein